MASSRLPENNDTIIEGLTGRLPLLVSGIIFFFANTICFQLRAVLHRDSAVIDGAQIVQIVLGWVALVLLVAPLTHTLSHVAAITLAGKPLRWIRKWWYPRVRPVGAVSRSQAMQILLAPLVLAVVLLLLLVVAPLSGAAAVWGSVNIALSANDIWKVIGLLRFPVNTHFVMEADHLRRVEASQ